VLTTVQGSIAQLQQEIARLEPFAKAERLADVAGVDNFWAGSGKALKEAQAALDRELAKREAEAFAADVRSFLELRDRRNKAAGELAEYDAKVALFSETTRAYFVRANDIAKWVERANGTMPYPSVAHTAQQRDPYGNVLDVPPRDHRHVPVVPDEEWESVKALRELQISRGIVGRNLATMDQSIRDIVARNPALVSIPPR
jgi:hypothetical protein